MTVYWKGEVFDTTIVHIIDDMEYPPNWWDKETRDAWGMTGEPDPVIPPPTPIVIPVPVSLRGWRRMLYNRGLMVDFETAINAVEGSEGDLLRIDYQCCDKIGFFSALGDTARFLNISDDTVRRAMFNEALIQENMN